MISSGSVLGEPDYAARSMVAIGVQFSFIIILLNLRGLGDRIQVTDAMQQALASRFEFEVAERKIVRWRAGGQALPLFVAGRQKELEFSFWGENEDATPFSDRR